MPPHPSLHQALCGVAALVLLWPALRWFERVNLYFPDRAVKTDPGSLRLKFEEFLVRAKDGPTIHGWFAPGEPAGPVLLVSHGNGGNISHRLDKLLLFRQAGASVLMYDYRGYGKSTGRPDEAGTYEDAEAAYAWLVGEKRVPPERIVFYGESLGGAVAAEMALRRPCAGLILDSAFTSVVDMGARVFPFLPVRWIVRNRYDSLSKIGRVRCPVLVMHSAQDDIVPYEMGRRLFAAAPEPKTFFEMQGSHNDGFLETGLPYGDAIGKFLRSLPLAAPGG